MKLKLALAASLLALAACAPPSKEAVVKTYNLAGPIIHVMIVDKTKLQSSDDLPALAKDYCTNRAVKGCFVWVYFDESRAPLEGQGGETAKGDPIFDYTSNWATNLESELWNCTIYPQGDDNKCLALSRGGA